jgi:hypothetical protein
MRYRAVVPTGPSDPIDDDPTTVFVRRPIINLLFHKNNGNATTTNHTRALFHQYILCISVALLVDISNSPSSADHQSQQALRHHHHVPQAASVTLTTGDCSLPDNLLVVHNTIVAYMHIH